MIKIKEMLCIKVSTCSDGVMCGRAATSFSLSRLFQLFIKCQEWCKISLKCFLVWSSTQRYSVYTVIEEERTQKQETSKKGESFS